MCVCVFYLQEDLLEQFWKLQHQYKETGVSERLLLDSLPNTPKDMFPQLKNMLMFISDEGWIFDSGCSSMLEDDSATTDNDKTYCITNF